MTRRFVLVSIIILAATAAAPLFAAEVTGKGEAIIVAAEPKETELEGGKKYLELFTQEILLADGDHPFHYAAITCSGSCKVNAAGDAKCAGGCNGLDPDGDVLLLSWDGFKSGGWKLTGGTGKWRGSSGKGTWKSKGPMGAGFARNVWQGTIDMK